MDKSYNVIPAAAGWFVVAIDEDNIAYVLPIGAWIVEVLPDRMGNWVYLDAAAEELVLARQQRDAVQRALDKANRDNDALRAELRARDMIIDDLRQELSMANAGLRVALDPKRLVDGGEGYYEAWSAAGGE